MSFRFNKSRPVWHFKSGRFTVALYVQRDTGYRYDGEDPDGEVQAKLDSGEYVAFDSDVIVTLDDREIARVSLGGSVYASDEVPEFWTAHRDPDPMNRNCSIMRKARGANVGICHYFPDMVREVIGEARRYVRDMPVPPRLRAA